MKSFRDLISKILKGSDAQSTHVFCPGCKLDLVSRAGGEDGTTVVDQKLVNYICGNCKTYSEWNFDIAPAPILLRAEQHRMWVPRADDDGITRIYMSDKLLGHWKWKPK